MPIGSWEHPILPLQVRAPGPHLRKFGSSSSLIREDDLEFRAVVMLGWLPFMPVGESDTLHRYQDDALDAIPHPIRGRILVFRHERCILFAAMRMSSFVHLRVDSFA